MKKDSENVSKPVRKLHVAGAQIQSKAMDPRGNLERMHRQIQIAALSGVEAILFGETCVHAYCLYPENLALAEPADGPICRQISEWSAKYGLVIMAGMLEKSGLGIHNSHYVAFPGGDAFTIRKHVMTANEKKAKLTPGDKKRRPFEINGVRCGLYICADGSIRGLHADMARQGVELYFLPTAGGGFRPEYVTDADMDTAEGKLKFMDDAARTYMAGVVDRPQNFHKAYVAVNAYGDDGAFMIHRGGINIINKRRIVQARIWDTNCIDYFTDQLCHAILHF